ncbi:MAG: S1 family peptidase [Armatimonadota bacterium]
MIRFLTGSLAWIGLVLGLAVFSLPARADETAEAGRKVVEQWQQSVVTLEVVSKITVSMFGETQSEEMQNEVRGVVLDPSGLVVTALSIIDPMAIVADMMEGEEMAEGMNAKAEFTSVKYLLADGTSVPAQIVLRDKDLDLAFFRPLKAPEKPMASLSFDRAATPQLLDSVYVLDRLGATGNRAIAITPDRVKAVIEKPRRLYVMINADTPGIPAFTENGDIIGILTLRRPPKGAQSSMGMGVNDWMVVAIPLAEVQAVAKQAPAVAAK